MEPFRLEIGAKPPLPDRLSRERPQTTADGDGATGFSDLVAVLAAFGNSPAGDLDADGDTDFADLVLLLGDYGCGAGG